MVKYGSTSKKNGAISKISITKGNIDKYVKKTNITSIDENIQLHTTLQTQPREHPEEDQSNEEETLINNELFIPLFKKPYAKLWNLSLMSCVTFSLRPHYR